MAPVQQPNCYHCGCTAPEGDCGQKACADIPIGTCESCGCDLTGTCTTKPCSTWGFDCSAGGDLEKCAYCGCDCCYHINETCQITAGFTCGGVVIDSLGQVTHTAGTISTCAFWKDDDPAAFYYKTNPAAALHIYGRNPCCP